MRYEYGVIHREDGVVETHPTKTIAENAARDWVISPLRTGPRTAHTVRRTAGRIPGIWSILNTWTTPESAEEKS